MPVPKKTCAKTRGRPSATWHLACAMARFALYFEITNGHGSQVHGRDANASSPCARGRCACRVRSSRGARQPSHGPAGAPREGAVGRQWHRQPPGAAALGPSAPANAGTQAASSAQCRRVRPRLSTPGALCRKSTVRCVALPCAASPCAAAVSRRCTAGSATVASCAPGSRRARPCSSTAARTWVPRRGRSCCRRPALPPLNSCTSPRGAQAPGRPAAARARAPARPGGVPQAR